MTAIFISHSSADNTAAAQMKEWLKGLGHTSLFLDFDPEAGIRSGSDWEQTLYQKLRQCQAVIALLTPNWLASKWCFVELAQARAGGKAIFPVKIQDCQDSGVFSDIQHIDLRVRPEEVIAGWRLALKTVVSIHSMSSTGIPTGRRIPVCSPSRSKMRRFSLVAAKRF